MTPPGAPRRRKWLRVLSLAVLIVLVGYFAAYLISLELAKADLRAAIAEVDAAEPNGWQLEDLEARRLPVADDKNGAKVLLEAAAELPKDWKAPKLLDDLYKVRPCEQLPNEIATEPNDELRPLEQVRQKSRRLAEYPQGRFPPAKFAPKFWFDTPAHLDAARSISNVLFADATALAHAKDWDEAWGSALALLNGGRSLAGEQDSQGQLLRMAAQFRAVLAFERILGQCVIPEQKLARARQMLQQEIGENLIEEMLQGQRAGLHRFFTGLVEGNVEFPGIDKHVHGTDADLVFCSLGLRGSMIRNSHAYLLRTLTKRLEYAKGPVRERYKGLAEVIPIEDKSRHSLRQIPRLAAPLTAVFWKLALAEFRADTHMACAAAGLAAEEYRLRHRHWPRDLEELVKAGLLPTIPMDVYDGQPLRIRKVPDGLVVYSLGWLKEYRGDARDPGYPKGKMDPELQIEFRLWNESRRRQPPWAGMLQLLAPLLPW
jgi:hypothetical protein